MIKILDTKNLILSPMQGAGVGDDFFMSPQPNWKMIADFVRLIQYFLLESQPGDANVLYSNKIQQVQEE